MTSGSGSAVSTRTPPVEVPEYRMFRTEVVRTQRLSASFVRITVGSDPLRDFGAAGADQRIKLFLPRVPGTPVELDRGSDWYLRWRAQPEDARPYLRTYTVRAARPHLGELDIDVVLHGVDSHDAAGLPAGPAASWAASARPGDPLVLLGPDRPGQGGRAWGVEWAPPASARWLLLAGDETAVPAIGAILEALPSGIPATACLEVPDPSDVQPWRLHPAVEVRWAFRENHRDRRHGELLATSLRDVLASRQDPLPHTAGEPVEDADVDTSILWDVPDPSTGAPPETYAWLAGEAGAIRALRRYLVTELGMPRTAVAFMGYWRLGRAEAN